MANKDAFITFLLDRTGSMAEMWDEALGGLNAFVEEQANQEGYAWMTLISFDSIETKVEHDGVIVIDYPTITEEDISPRGMTPLFDATAFAIQKAESWLEDNEQFEGKTIVVVLTDGYENASQEWKLDALRELINKKQEEGWEFLFLASNQDAWKEGSKMGYVAGQTQSYAPTGQSMQGTIANAAAAVTQTRQTGVELRVDSEEKHAKTKKVHDDG